MKLWIDAQLPPALARWLVEVMAVEAVPVRDLGLRDAGDLQIFEAARAAGAVVVTKDADFVTLLERLGAPPQVLWVTSGNTSNVRLREIFTAAWPEAARLLAAGEPLVEICDRPPARTDT